MRHYCLLFIICVFVVVGCGKKQWPQPRIIKERFAWEQIRSSRSNRCLNIAAAVSGKSENIKSVVLELTEAGSWADCPGCPFSPTLVEEINRTDTAFVLKNSQLRLKYCKIEKNRSYRWRLIAKNIYSSLPDAVSVVLYSGPAAQQ